MEIYQLYKYTCVNKNCFCIVLSPRNDGIKFLCAKLTARGFAEMKKFECIVNGDPFFTETTKLTFLSKSISDSDVDFYRHIPCTFCDETCVYHDSRDVQAEITKIKDFVSSPSSSLW